jgi:hypothetical protein
MQLLMLHERESNTGDRLWAGFARAHIHDACLLLEQHAGSAEALASAVELILKAELALASLSASKLDLSLRVADQLLLEARVEVEAKRTK